jgi:hypothetical protein
LGGHSCTGQGSRFDRDLIMQGPSVPPTLPAKWRFAVIRHRVDFDWQLPVRHSR